jgi:hypothetical protein
LRDQASCGVVPIVSRLIPGQAHEHNWYKGDLDKTSCLRADQCKQFRSVLALAKGPEGITKIVAFACL